MVDFSDLVETVRALDNAQSYDEETRFRAREAIRFVEEPDGQWEDHVRDLYDQKPRFQIDKVTPIVNQIAARIMDNDFGIKVEPMGDGADAERSKLIAGIVRDVEARSNAADIYSYATVEMVKGGFSAWRVTSDYVDEKTFDQELRIEPIYGALDRVWFDPASVHQDKRDAKYCFVVNSMSKDDFEKRWPDRQAADVDQNLEYQKQYTLSDGKLVYVGQVYYIKEENATLAEMEGPNGSIITKEIKRGETKLFKQAGYKFIRRRPVRRTKCYSRLFGPDAWLTPEEETVFSSIPVVPVYSDYAIVTNQQMYRGVIEKLMDPQRILNYTKSEEVTQVALGAKPKPWLTPTQAEGFETSLATSNTNTQAYQLYNADPQVQNPPPMVNPATVNPNLFQVSESMSNAITEASGQFAASMGDVASAKHSGYAIDKLQQAGDLGVVRFLKSMEIGICRTFYLLVEGIPRIIDTERDVRVRGEDGQIETETVNMKRGGVVENDLSQGRYDVTCEVGPSYKNKQQETVASIVETAKVDPSVMMLGQDVFLKNSNYPGSDELSERARIAMIQNGIIPVTQWTDEEKQQVMEAQQQAAQNQQPDPAMLLAEAEMAKGQADLIKAQNEQAKIQLQASGKGADVQLKAQAQEHSRQMDMFKAQMDMQRLELDKLEQGLRAEKEMFEAEMVAGTIPIEQRQARADYLNTQANTLKTLREAMGLDSVIAAQSTEVSEAQRLQ